MNAQHDRIELIRLRVAAAADRADARMWRWFSEQIEEQQMDVHNERGYWLVRQRGRELARDRSFDVAMRAAYVLGRALQSL